MKKQHKNAAVIDVPDYKTLKEIIVHGTEMGGDKKMLVYLDKNKAEHIKTYNDEWKDMSEMATCYYLDGLTGKKRLLSSARTAMSGYAATMLRSSAAISRYRWTASCRQRILRISSSAANATLLFIPINMRLWSRNSSRTPQ